MFSIPTAFNKQVFDIPNVKKFISSTGKHYDLIILEDFFADSFLMFAHKFKAPIVTVCELLSIVINIFLIHAHLINLMNYKGSYGVSHPIDRQHGLLSPPSFVPFYVSR